VTTWPAAVLFDMDGTLIESHANVERAWATWAAQRDLDVQAVLAMAHGLPADVTVAHWFPEASADEVLALSAEQLRLQYEDVEGIDDTELPWAIYTSADAELARVRLRSAGLKPRVLVTRDQVKHGKPAPDGYLRAARLLAVPADQCIVIEDTDVGLAAGRAAGMTTVGVRGVVGDLPVRSISELHLWLAVKTAPTTLNGPDLPLPGD
jgi:sugar-phosphatase